MTERIPLIHAALRDSARLATQLINARGAERALQMGLVQELVPAGQALKRARELAREIADHPQPALIADRRGVVASTDRSLQSGIDFEAVVGRPVLHDPIVVERLAAYSDRHR